jgi:hypothetical protein
MLHALGVRARPRTHGSRVAVMNQLLA